MAINPKDKHEAEVVSKWLRRCFDNQDVCKYCPFNNVEEDCMTKLSTTAADLLEKLVGLRQ